MESEEAKIPISIADEQIAIKNHDYDQAEAIYQARLETERQDFDDDTNNILDSVDQAKIMNSSKCIQEMEKSTRNLENGRDILTSSLAEELEKLAGKQKEELETLKSNWRSDREQAINRAVERADNMILSSQELAAVHCYEAAKDLLAQGTEIKENPTATKEVSEIDEHYRRL
ncbi:hypothetical protein TVAGG3_0679880, partial [Trichomonas vaginalis G3]|uniref:hypothetical protein n=1 Tax=Trichomonas vaginalis (strain ATCC PRA-98 / G3) TaxID=412133 RepID=UPI0021E5563B